jgi:hypothetical protein
MACNHISAHTCCCFGYPSSSRRGSTEDSSTDNINVRGCQMQLSERCKSKVAEGSTIFVALNMEIHIQEMKSIERHG